VRVLQIIGYGRSGSTLVEIMLSQQKGVVGIGEVDNISSWVTQGYVCSCGSKLEECGFWGDVLKRLGDMHIQPSRPIGGVLGRMLQGIVGAFAPLGAPGVRYEAEQLVGELDTLYECVGCVSGAGLVIDSTKSAGVRHGGRAIVVARYTRLETFFVHLVRDPRAVAMSAIERPGSPEGKKERRGGKLREMYWFLRTLVSWGLTEILVSWACARIGRERVLRVKYEELVREPELAVRRIGALVGEDFRDVIDALEGESGFVPGHLVGGNRLRFEREIKLRRREAVGDVRLSNVKRALYWVSAGPVGWIRRYR